MERVNSVVKKNAPERDANGLEFVDIILLLDASGRTIQLEVGAHFEHREIPPFVIDIRRIEFEDVSLDFSKTYIFSRSRPTD